MGAVLHHEKTNVNMKVLVVRQVVGNVGRVLAVSVRGVAKSKDKQAVPRGDGNVLLAIHLVTDRPGDDFATEIHFPQQRASVRIERLEVALAPSGEHQIRRGGQNPAHINVVHLETPLFLSGVGIESDNGAVAERLRVGIDGTRSLAPRIIGAGNGAGVCAARIA